MAGLARSVQEEFSSGFLVQIFRCIDTVGHCLGGLNTLRQPQGELTLLGGWRHEVYSCSRK